MHKKHRNLNNQSLPLFHQFHQLALETQHYIHNPENYLIWRYATDWTHSVSYEMLTFSPDVRMQTLQYKLIFLLLNTLKLLINLALQKKNSFKAIFHSGTQTPRSSKKEDLGEKKNAVGVLVTCGKTPTTVAWNECLKMYRRVIVTQ